ncbi:MAG TPA: hypothetical protein VJ867_12125 [Gemmatimonadaceae bacterium]|nr:hypothetical protein [Gemmatimonadaceae bacterium]
MSDWRRYMRRHGRRRTARHKRFVTAGFVGGMLAGLVLWSIQLQRCRRDLFNPRPLRRLAALGYLGGQHGLETAQILSEYLRWEKHPSLRRRAERLLRRMQAAL